MCGVVPPDASGLVVGVSVRGMSEPDELAEEVGGVAQNRVLAGPEDCDLPLLGYLAQRLEHVATVDVAEAVPQLIEDENTSLRPGVRNHRGQHELDGEYLHLRAVGDLPVGDHAAAGGTPPAR